MTPGDFLDLIQTLFEHWWSEFTDLGDWPYGTFDSIAEYIDLYPLVVCLLWCVYGLNSLVRSFWNKLSNKPLPKRLPGYTALVPFYAEPEGAVRTARSLERVYPVPEEILLIDDGSPAGRGADAIDLAKLPPRTRIIRLEDNRGKAAALNSALHEVRSEVILCLDADTIVHSPSLEAMLARFVTDATVGAVTGKLWPAETRSLCNLMQALDYLAVVGLVKNAEHQWGGLMTVSGAFVTIRRAALMDVGAWNQDTATEDIDLSWRLQGAGWRLAYEWRCTALVEMVPTWRGLWRQRRRWSRGLGHTMREQFSGALRPGATHLPICLLTLLGIGWLWATLAIGALRIFKVVTGQFVARPEILIHLMFYFAICFGFFLCQVLIATLLDRARWRLYPWLFLVAPLYPLYFWVISLSTFVVGFPQGLLRRDGGRWRRTQRSSEFRSDP